MNVNRIIAWGANSCGQLGAGAESEYELPTEIKHNINSAIIQISAGARHTVVIDEGRNLWLAGRSDLKGFERNLSQFTKHEMNFKCLRVSCGWDVTAAISEHNQLFIWGNNSSNQLGLQVKGIIREPTELKLPEQEIPIDVKFGLKFIAILTKSRKIFVTGSLKPFYKSSSKHFTIFSHNSLEWLKIDDINLFTCGQNHISFVNTERPNVILGIGDNKFGQCEEQILDEKIVQLCSGWTHNAFLTESNKLFFFGRNNYGQLGNGNRDSRLSQFPTSPVDEFALGAEHGILMSKGRIYTWGWNEHRNCGIDQEEDILSPTCVEIEGERVKQIFAGAGFCIVLL